MSAEAIANHREIGEQVGRLLSKASLHELQKEREWEQATARKLDILREFEGVTLYLSARAIDKEDTKLKRIETYQRRDGEEMTDWLEPGYYRLGELDISKPTHPMIFLHREGEPDHIRYFAYADDVVTLD